LGRKGKIKNPIFLEMKLLISISESAAIYFINIATNQFILGEDGDFLAQMLNLTLMLNITQMPHRSTCVII
jgi:hypothetical protein